jgi:hypothetical protein
MFGMADELGAEYTKITMGYHLRGKGKAEDKKIEEWEWV